MTRGVFADDGHGVKTACDVRMRHDIHGHRSVKHVHK